MALKESGPIRKILSERKTIILDEPLIKRIGLTGQALEYDSELAQLRNAKMREWTAKGYSPKLQSMAFELAGEWADRMSDWMLRIIEEPNLKRKAYTALYKEGLDMVAERWIQSMSA